MSPTSSARRPFQRGRRARGGTIVPVPALFPSCLCQALWGAHVGPSGPGLKGRIPAGLVGRPGGLNVGASDLGPATLPGLWTPLCSASSEPGGGVPRPGGDFCVCLPAAVPF